MIDEFFERPKFWMHLKACLLYPWLLFKHSRQMKILAERSVRWRELATTSVVPRPENLQNIQQTVKAVVEDLEHGKLIPEPSTKKTY